MSGPVRILKLKTYWKKLVYAWLFSEGCLIVKHIKQDAFDFCKLSSGTLPATHQCSNNPWNIIRAYVDEIDSYLCKQDTVPLYLIQRFGECKYISCFDLAQGNVVYTFHLRTKNQIQLPF